MTPGRRGVRTPTAVKAAAPTTGHAASPATVIIKKKMTKTPKALPKKGRKSAGRRVSTNDVKE